VFSKTLACFHALAFFEATMDGLNFAGGPASSQQVSYLAASEIPCSRSTLVRQHDVNGAAMIALLGVMVDRGANLRGRAARR
jgi:hypothetical protein